MTEERRGAHFRGPNYDPTSPEHLAQRAKAKARRLAAVMVPREKAVEARSVEGLPIPEKEEVHRSRTYIPPRRPEPWERQGGEPNRAYNGFRIYRDGGSERTLSRTAKDMHLLNNVVRAWYISWRWAERVTAWDQEVDKRDAQGRLKAVEAASKRHANLAQVMQRQVAERLRDHTAASLSNKDLDRWLEKSVRIERQALGMSGEGPRTQINVTAGATAQAAAKSEASVGPQSLADLIAGDPENLNNAMNAIETLLQVADGAGVSMGKDEPDL